MERKLIPLILIMVLLLQVFYPVSVVSALPGELDSSFSGDGLVVEAAPLGGQLAYGQSIHVTDSGDVFVAGFSNNAQWHGYATVWKYGADGVLDDSFSADGIVTLIGAAQGTYDSASDITVDSQGRIIVVGSSKFNDAGTTHLAVWRLNPNGTLDTSFHGDGIYESRDLGQSLARGVVVGPDDKIYVSASYGGGMSIWKFNTNGWFDNSFGTNGRMWHPTNSYGYSIEMDSQGRLLVAGKAWNSTLSRWEPSVWRVNPNGTFDSTFGTNGKFSYFFSPGSTQYQQAEGVVIFPDDSVAIAGYVTHEMQGRDAFVIRLDEYGQLDTSFSNDGVAITGYTTGDGRYTWGTSIKADANGNILAAGFSQNQAPQDDPKGYFTKVWRFTPDGNLDSSFASNGIFSSFAGASSGGVNKPNSLDIDSSGRIFATGATLVNNINHMAIWAIQGGEVVDAYVDIRPGECVNYLDVTSTGVVTATISAGAEYDIEDIVTSSIRIEGATPVQVFVQDMSDITDCSEPSDGNDDLVFRFRVSQLSTAILNELDGETVDLRIWATLEDGNSIMGQSTVTIINN